MPRTAAKLCSLALLLMTAKASLAAATQSLQIPFEYGPGGNTILLHVQVNDKPASLVLNTGSPQTTLRPEFFGIKPRESTQTSEKRITLQVGAWRWLNRRIFVNELAEAPAENIDGILGLDFLQEFSQIIINVRSKSIIFIDEGTALSDISFAANSKSGKLSLGNLTKLTLEGADGQYRLNGASLPKISSDSIELSTEDQSHRLRITFFKSVLVSSGKSLESANQAVLDSWARKIPLVKKILSDNDPIGSLKPLIYEPVEPKGKKDLQIQEELVLLWSSDSRDTERIGNTFLLPPLFFSSPIADVQYRGLTQGAERLTGKIYLQIIYMKDLETPYLMGGFVIVSRPDGQFEFYIVPRELLNRIVTDSE